MSGAADTLDGLTDGLEEADERDIFKVDLDGYEGPLHLMLDLARRQKINLLQISMLRLAEQYLVFVEEAKTRRVDLAADYLLMASWLAFMKSRLLLPKPEAPSADEPSGEEMAARLAFRLRRLEAMRDAVRDLYAGPVLGQRVFLRGETEQPKVVRLTAFTATLYELTSAFGAIRGRRTQAAPHRIERQFVLPLEIARTTLRSLRTQLDEWSSLDSIRESITDLDPALPERSVTASVFSAALELARDGEVDVRQERHFAPIYLKNIPENDPKPESDA